MKQLSHHLNFNTLLLAVLGALGTYFWNDVHESLTLVKGHVTDIAVLRVQVEDLKNNCVTEARMNDLLARARATKGGSPRNAGNGAIGD